jgi:hypothetical protein
MENFFQIEVSNDEIFWQFNPLLSHKVEQR